MKAMHVTPGMTVLGQDDVELGRIKEVWAETRAHGYLPLSRYHLQDYGPIKGTSQIFSAEEGFLQIRQGDSAFFGGRDLWVPLDAVVEVDTETTVKLEMEARTYQADFVDQPALSGRAA